MTENTTPATDAAKSYDWREDMRKAGALKDRAAGANKQASERLWRACKAGVSEWLPESGNDASAEGLYSEFIKAYGESRKGDCSKMKSVALAAKDHGLVLSQFPNLSKAYAEARRLTQTVKQEKADDEAADKAVEALAAEAPNTASTPENAAKIVLAKGVDEAARLLLDALGVDNAAAHRALLRAMSNEIAGRVKPKASTTKAGPKAGAVQVKGGAKSTPKAAPAKAATKAKPVAKKAAAQTKAVPVSKSKGDPNKRALPTAKAAPVDETPGVAVESNIAAVKAKPVAKPRGVVKRPAVKRG